MIATIKFLMIILPIATFLTVKFKFKQENSILIIFLSGILLIYGLGVFNIMIGAVYILVVLAVLSTIYIIYAAIKKNVVWRDVFTLGTLIYIFIALVLSVVLKNTYFREWDEFSHWGPNLKAMVENDLFWSNNKYDGIHVVYQPLAGLIEYLFCKLNGGFSESIAYIGVDVGILTLLIPILKNLKYKIADIIKAVLFFFSMFCLIYIFYFSLESIYIDFMLGVMFAIGLFVANNCEEVEDKILLVLILLSMAELKTTGLLFDGIILIVVFLQKVIRPIIKEKKITKKVWKNFAITILLLVSVLIAYKSWDIYCKSNNRVLDRRHDNNFISEINIKEYVKAVLQYGSRSEKTDTIAKSFYEAIDSRPIISHLPYKTILQIFIALDVVLIIMFITSKDKEERSKILILGIAINVGMVLYCLLLMATYMFAFTETEGRGLFSLERYMSTFFMAWIINVMAILLNRGIYLKTLSNGKKVVIESSIISMAIIAIICLIGIDKETLKNPIQKKSSGVPEYIAQKAEIVTSNLNRGDKVFVIFQDPGVTVDPFVFRYCISPIVMNLMDEYSLGELDSPDDHMTLNITEQEWEQKLIDENYDYVFILKSDEEFKETYKDIFEENTDFENLDDKIFKVNKINDNDVVLTLYN